MGDWALISWWVGGGVAVAALVVVALSLFRDRARGRRRCPSCWYDMAGVAGMMCPECGQTQKNEKRFFRTRRRWRGVALGGVMLVVAGGTAVAPAVYTGKWAKYTPVPVLRAGLKPFKGDAARVRERVAGKVSVATLTSWERLLLASAMAQELREMLESPSDPRWADPVTLNSPAGGVYVVPRPNKLWEICNLAATLGDEARPMLPELVLLLQSTDPTQSAAAAGALGTLGVGAAPVAPELRRLLVELRNTDARELCVRSLMEIDAGSGRTREVLRRVALGNGHGQVRLAAASALADVEPERASTLDAFIGLLEDTNPGRRCECVLALGWYAHSEVATRPTLRAGRPMMFLGRPAPGWFVEERPGEPNARAVEAVARALDDAEDSVRLRAANVLGGVGERVAPHLARVRACMEKEKDPTVRRALITAYVKVETADVGLLLPEFMALLQNGKDDERRWAAWRLSDCGARGEAAVPALEKVAWEERGSEDGLYCQTLGFIGGEGWRVLDDMVRSGQALGRHAARSLGMAGTQHAEAAAYLLAEIREEDPEVRAMAALGMGYCERNAEVIAALEELALRDRDLKVRLMALIALGSAGDGATVVRVCTAALQDAEQRVRDLAQLTLRERAEKAASEEGEKVKNEK